MKIVRQTQRKTLHADEKGAAYTEAVVMLPVYILVFALFYMVHDSAIAKTISMSESRQAGWAAAFSDCGGGDESGCPSCSATAEGFPTDDGTAMGSLRGAVSDIGGEGIVGGALSGVLGSLLDGLFGGQVTRYGNASYDRPAYLGGGTVDVSSGYTMVCNPERQTIGSILGDVWDGIIGDIF